MRVEDAQVGMRVKYIGDDDFDFGPRTNQVGIIMKISSDGYYEITIDFDEPFNEGHQCSGECKDKCGYWFYPPNDSDRQNDNFNYIVSAYEWRKL